jgi:hypothetical protein
MGIAYIKKRMKVQFVLMALEIVYFVFLGQGLEEQ